MQKKDTQEKMPPVIILCGGRGTRLMEVTELLPKPMVEIGEQPIIWHIMRCFAAFGVKRFILCLGYKKEKFIDYFVNYHIRTTDVTIKLGHDPDILYHGDTEAEDWQVTLAGTGLDSMTGCRVFRAARYLQDTDREFFLTYGDGLADINIADLLKFHREHGKLLTCSAVHPASRFGAMNIVNGLVRGFEEKPAKPEGYINGGYMVVNREFIPRYLSDDPALSFEKEPMLSAVRDSQMVPFCHEGFWQCMDTPREYQLLNELWKRGNAPWTANWR